MEARADKNKLLYSGILNGAGGTLKRTGGRTGRGRGWVVTYLEKPSGGKECDHLRLVLSGPARETKAQKLMIENASPRLHKPSA